MNKGFACPQSVLSRWGSEDKFTPNTSINVRHLLNLVTVIKHCGVLQRDKSSRTPPPNGGPAMTYVNRSQGG